MTPEQYQRATELFLAAVELDQSKRDAFLADACGPDDDLRRSVESLLANDCQDTFINYDPDNSAHDDTVPNKITAGRRDHPTSGWLRTAWLTPYLSPRGQFAVRRIRGGLAACLAGGFRASQRGWISKEIA